MPDATEMVQIRRIGLLPGIEALKMHLPNPPLKLYVSVGRMRRPPLRAARPRAVQR